jgi:DNA adenine methylase
MPKSSLQLSDVASLEAKRANLTGLLKWAGGKASIARTLIPAISSRRPRRFIEPFAGGAAIFFRLGPTEAILGDSNVHLMRFYLAVKRNPRQVYLAIESIRSVASKLRGPSFRVFYYELRDQFPRVGLYENAALFVFLNRHCWNGLYRENSLGRFNTPIGSYESLQPTPDLQQLSAASRLLQSATLRIGDFAETVALAEPGDVVYLDPPYLPVSSTSRFSSYQTPPFSWRDQVRLKKVLYDLQDRNIDFILSNSFQPLTRAFYADFRYHYTVMTAGTISSSSATRKARRELVVTSFSTKALEAYGA